MMIKVVTQLLIVVLDLKQLILNVNQVILIFQLRNLNSHLMVKVLIYMVFIGIKQHILILSLYLLSLHRI